MMVRQGAATTSVTLRGDVDAVVETLVTPSLMAVDLAATRLDRVGGADASITVTADEIALGAIRARTADLRATAGDIRTIDSTAGSTITVAQPSGPDLEVSTDDIAFTDRLVDVSGPLKVSATGNVDLVRAMNAGQRVNNALREVEVDEPVGGALTIETSETIAVTRSDPAITVGSANVTGEKSVSLDVNSLGDTMGRSTGGADDTLLVSGEIAGDATADASGNASINGMIGGDARATATDGNALIEGSVTGDAVADAGGNATIRGNEVVNGANDPTVLGNVTGNAELTAGADATLNARVGGDATVTAGRNSDVSGKVDNDLDIDADNAIVLASKGPLTVDGTLDATSDAEGGGGNTATITQVEAVTVMGATTLDANSQSDITLDNGGNDFTEVAIDGAAKVDLVDDATLDIANIEDVTGDLSIVARNGTLTLQDPGSGDDYRIAANQIWTLQATTGDLTLDGRIDSPEGSPFTGSLVLAGGEDNTIRIKNLIGARSPLNDVTIKDSKNLIFGLRTDGDFTMPEALSESEFLLQPGTEEDIFFVRTLNIQGVDGQILLLVPTETEFIFDFEDAYFGLNIAESDGFNYDGGEAIDLFGSIGGIRSRASGLSPIGPRGGTSEFNNCLIGDPNSCSALTQANVLRLVDVTPDNVFVLDPDQVEQLFLSFGNEELWGLPSVFAIDIADDDDEEDDDESEGTQ